MAKVLTVPFKKKRSKVKVTRSTYLCPSVYATDKSKRNDRKFKFGTQIVRSTSSCNSQCHVPFSSHDATHSTDYAVARCPSVRPSHAGIPSKRL